MDPVPLPELKPYTLINIVKAEYFALFPVSARICLCFRFFAGVLLPVYLLKSFLCYPDSVIFYI